MKCARYWTRTFAQLSFLVLALSLQACSTTSTKPFSEPKVLPPEACLSLAEPLIPLSDPSMESLLRKLLEVAGEYYTLAARHGCLVEFNRGR